MSLSDVLLRSDLINDEMLVAELEWGFPQALRDKYPTEIRRHQLRNEIISTVLANEVVNWGGLTFVFEIKEETGLGVDDIVAAFCCCTGSVRAATPLGCDQCSGL